MLDDFDGDAECGVCGVRYQSRTGGRPSLYCGKECRDTASALSFLQNRISNVQARCTDARWRKLRGDIWRLVNHRGVSDKTGARRAKGVRNELIAQVAEENGGRALEIWWSPLRAKVVCEFDVHGRREFEVAADLRCSQRRREDRMLEAYVEQVRALDRRVG